MLAVIAANMPFLNERLFAVIPLSTTRKSAWLRLLELLTSYIIVGIVARLLETRIGNAFAQGWEFYAVTLCLFLVLAYPGFVFRYLRKRRD
jgi:hypothetical protein